MARSQAMIGRNGDTTGMALGWGVSWRDPPGEWERLAAADHPAGRPRLRRPERPPRRQRGPGLLEDFHFREKIFHFDHERIPERVVHARGFGAHGYFENYESLSNVTRADLFQRPGQRTPAFVRFSTVAGNKGSATWPGTYAASR